MKYLTILLLVLAGCADDGIQTSQTNNIRMHVTLLFEQDGIKVYRFNDAGYYHYFTDHGETSSIQNCGKSCIHNEVIK